MYTITYTNTLYMHYIYRFIQQIMRKNHGKLSIVNNNNRDLVREETVDELSSVLIWVLITLIGLDILSLKTGVALGSIFAGCVHYCVYHCVYMLNLCMYAWYILQRIFR